MQCFPYCLGSFATLIFSLWDSMCWTEWVCPSVVDSIISTGNFALEYLCTALGCFYEVCWVSCVFICRGRTAWKTKEEEKTEMGLGVNYNPSHHTQRCSFGVVFSPKRNWKRIIFVEWSLSTWQWQQAVISCLANTRSEYTNRKENNLTKSNAIVQCCA